MTDILRDRITLAVASELLLQARACGEYQTRDSYKVADAVIRELGLRRETESYGMPDSTRHRYVTAWESE